MPLLSEKTPVTGSRSSLVAQHDPSNVLHSNPMKSLILKTPNLCPHLFLSYSEFEMTIEVEIVVITQHTLAMFSVLHKYLANSFKNQTHAI